MVRSLAFAAGMLCCTTLGLHAQVEGPQPVSIVVRAESKGTVPMLQPSDLKVEFANKPVTLQSVQSLAVGRQQGVRTEIALLIDDGLRGSFGNQLSDIEAFVRNTVSPNVVIGIGYMRNGGSYFPAGFSNDAETELKAIRLPIASSGIDGSPYFCLQDLLKKWPQHPGVARVVLMISSGIDIYNGPPVPNNQDSPYVAAAIKDAQRAGVPVYSIYYGRREVNASVPSFSGQSYLSQMGESTGGDSLNGGAINPISLAPYFSRFANDLRESYLVTFQTGLTRLERLKVSSNTKGIKVQAQDQAGVPGAK